ncbi:MAG: methyltransferase domain-containing protein [Ktedonobacterales bacterium]
MPGDSGYIGAHDLGEAERLGAQAAGGLDELRAALASHPVLPGARVLELGCGAGTFTRALLAALPDATIVATDVNDALLAQARADLTAEVRAGRVAFARADAANLLFPARSFDFVACRCLLMHQADPLLAVSEMFRVVDLGGGALAIEPDWGARALYPDADALDELLDLARRARPFGFPDLLLGRKLFALFRAAGFVQVRIGVSAFSETADDSDTALPGGDGALMGPARLIQQGRALLRQAGVEDARLDALIQRLHSIPRHPEYFSAGLDFSAIAIRPAPSLSLP